jgi:hypothetical protein
MMNKAAVSGAAVFNIESVRSAANQTNEFVPFNVFFDYALGLHVSPSTHRITQRLNGSIPGTWD